ncbi:uncharacterized protein ACOB8E_004644 [Sarcophilus harrisii]
MEEGVRVTGQNHWNGEYVTGQISGGYQYLSEFGSKQSLRLLSCSDHLSPRPAGCPESPHLSRPAPWAAAPLPGCWSTPTLRVTGALRRGWMEESSPRLPWPRWMQGGKAGGKEMGWPRPGSRPPLAPAGAAGLCSATVLPATTCPPHVSRPPGPKRGGSAEIKRPGPQQVLRLPAPAPSCGLGAVGSGRPEGTVWAAGGQAVVGSRQPGRSGLGSHSWALRNCCAGKTRAPLSLNPCFLSHGD